MHEFVDKQSVDLSGIDVITALLDADSITYIVGWEFKDSDDTEAVQLVTDQFVSQLLAQVQARQYAGFLSPKKTFRHELNPEYKANRGDPHPGIAKWKPFINEYLRQNWLFTEWDSHEADDAVAALQRSMANTIACSPDKDMKQVEGNHFDYKKGIRFYVTPERAMRHWAWQMLVGDATDNLKGCPGIGKVYATRFLEITKDRPTDEIPQLVFDVYVEKLGESRAKECYTDMVHMVTLEDNPEEKDMQFLRNQIHTFDLDAAGTSSYLSESDEATNLFGDW